jgi:hypothetical protein
MALISAPVEIKAVPTTTDCSTEFARRTKTQQRTIQQLGFQIYSVLGTASIAIAQCVVQCVQGKFS